MINNIRIIDRKGDELTVAANFVCYRFRRHERVREYVGAFRYRLRCVDDTLRIRERRIFIDAHELGSLGSVSFIL
jgi:p-cumate 2,3-dioxygenase beta subunit